MCSATGKIAIVTGATGCLGQALCAELAGHGWRLRTVSLRAGHRPKTPSERHLALNLATGDLPASMLDGADAIFHCAALSSAWGTAAAFGAANVCATSRVLRAARNARVPRFVFASTPSIYVNGQDRLNLCEDAPLPDRFLNDYARTKYQAEQMVRAANDAGMTTVALRPRAIYGEYDRALMPRLLRAIRRGPVPLIGGGGALIDPTHASDAARAMRLAAEADPQRVGGQVYNITSGQAVPLSDLLARLSAALKIPLRTRHMPFGIAMAIARSAEAMHRWLGRKGEPVLTRHAVAALGLSLTLNIGAAYSDLGYAPATSLGGGLQDLARIYHDSAV